MIYTGASAGMVETFFDEVRQAAAEGRFFVLVMDGPEDVTFIVAETKADNRQVLSLGAEVIGGAR